MSQTGRRGDSPHRGNVAKRQKGLGVSRTAVPYDTPIYYLSNFSFCILLFALGMGAALLGLISVEAVVDQIQTQDVKLKKDTSLMRNLQSKVIQLAAQSDNAAIKALAEEFRFSDPVSNAAISDAEADLAAAVYELQSAFVDGDHNVVAQLCHKASVLLAERNRLCKLNKK
jgi:hypothetical protein